MTRFALLIVLVFSSLLTSLGQANRIDPETTLKQLLAMPAPTPRTGNPLEQSSERKLRPPTFFDEDNAPPDDAPIEDVIDYWSRWSENRSTNLEPSETIRKRLLEATIDDPTRVVNLLSVLPKDEVTTAKLKKLYDKHQTDPDFDADKLRKWLKFNSLHFLDDLKAEAAKVRDHKEYAYVEHSEALTALSKLDWPSAETLLNQLVNGGQPRSKTFALSLFYQHAIRDKDSSSEERYRNFLKSIAVDRSTLGRARDTAIETLLLTEWTGRDEWYLSLFHDESLLDLRDGNMRFSPLCELVSKDPDQWIPVMARMVAGDNQTIRSAAAGCLVMFQLRSARKDALKPLLPWLANPEWASDNSMGRLRLIQSMEELDMPESVPGLIAVVENEKGNDDSERSYAAESLARYKDARAIPALKRALAKEKDGDNQQRYIGGLIASGGLSENEQVNGLVALATRTNETGADANTLLFERSRTESIPVGLGVGIFLSRQQTIDASLLKAVLARAELLKSTNPVIARLLLEIAHRWQGRQVDLDLINRIADGSADAATIETTLARAEAVRESVGDELRSLAASEGLAPGILAVLLDDSALVQSVLASGSSLSKAGLLAAARLTQTPLPVNTVGALLQSKDQLVSTAAEAYLLVEDSREARELLWAKHTDKAFITGWRQNIPTDAGDNFDNLGITEQKLRAELFKDDGPIETIALISNIDLTTHNQVLRIYENKAVFTFYENETRYRERVVTRAELASFKSFLTAENLAELGPQVGPCHHNCWVSELLLVSKNKGRRVFSAQGFGAWESLRQNFAQLEKGEGLKTRYYLETKIGGLAILYDNPDLVIADVWKRGDDFRVLFERPETDEERKERFRGDDEEEDELTRAERRRRKVAIHNSRFTWRAFENGKAGELRSQPDSYSTVDEARFSLDHDEDESGHNIRTIQQLTADSIVMTRNFDGVWSQNAGQKPVRLTEGGGAYADPVVTPDGKWLVLAKTDGSWGGPNYIVRLNLQSRRQYRVNLPPADDFSAVMYVTTHGKVLLRRAQDLYPGKEKSVGPDSPEYYLLDAATGQTQSASGDFAPLLQEGKRFLQPSGQPNEFWAAIPAEQKTQIGRYNLKDFTFKPLMTLPHIEVDSMSMWIDEVEAQVYVVYQSQLLRLPLKQVK